MEDRGPPALRLPPEHPPPVEPAMPPAPPVQLCAFKEQPPAPQGDPVQDPEQPAQMPVEPDQPQLHWSYFKPEISGKKKKMQKPIFSEQMTGWRPTISPEIAKIQRFCLTLTGEARLWYESLRHIVIDWRGLQEQFRQQYMKFGNT